jgi:spermidine/putrescine transport system substrate-binding protein
MMDYVYDPEVAAQIAEYVNYITPVPGARDVVLRHADEAVEEGDTETADYLRTVAESPLVFPTEEMLSRLYSYKVLDEDEERQWNELFQEVVQG